MVEPGTDGATPIRAGKSSPAPSPAHIVLGSSTYQLPQVTAQPVPVPTVAGTPLVDVGGGNYKVGSQIVSPGGATANVGGTSVHINPQGTPVVGSQTYPSAQTAATTTIGSHTIVVNTAGIIVNGQQIQPNASPVDVGRVPVQIQSPAVGNSPAGTDPASATNPAPILNIPGAQALTQILKQPQCVHDSWHNTSPRIVSRRNQRRQLLSRPIWRADYRNFYRPSRYGCRWLRRKWCSNGRKQSLHTTRKHGNRSQRRHTFSKWSCFHRRRCNTFPRFWRRRGRLIHLRIRYTCSCTKCFCNDTRGANYDSIECCWTNFYCEPVRVWYSRNGYKCWWARHDY